MTCLTRVITIKTEQLRLFNNNSLLKFIFAGGTSRSKVWNIGCSAYFSIKDLAVGEEYTIKDRMKNTE